jgi:hypothetical protein
VHETPRLNLGWIPWNGRWHPVVPVMMYDVNQDDLAPYSVYIPQPVRPPHILPPRIDLHDLNASPDFFVTMESSLPPPPPPQDYDDIDFLSDVIELDVPKSRAADGTSSALPTVSRCVNSTATFHRYRDKMPVDCNDIVRWCRAFVWGLEDVAKSHRRTTTKRQFDNSVYKACIGRGFSREGAREATKGAWEHALDALGCPDNAFIIVNTEVTQWVRERETSSPSTTSRVSSRSEKRKISSLFEAELMAFEEERRQERTRLCDMVDEWCMRQERETRLLINRMRSAVTEGDEDYRSDDMAVFKRCVR